MAGGLPKSGVSLVAEGTSAFMSSMNSAKGALSGFESAASKLGGGVSAMGQVVTGVFREIGAMVARAMADAARAVGGFIKDSLGVAGDFEQTLNVLGATSGATGDQLAAVGTKAKELGADLTLPATSANDAANVMLELSKAGFSVQEAMDAAKGSLQLAAAAQVDGAKAAEIMAGAINAFELEASDATRIADLLAAGANASSASMTDLAQGTQQAGFAFHAAGLPVEDLVTSLAALTNVGLTGSDAGTALKNALMRLMNPTKKAAELMADLGFSAYDANGKMKQLPDLLEDLSGALGGMDDKQRNAALGTIFLSDGMKAMIPLLNLGTDGFNALKGQVTQVGAASQVANAQMQGWNGAIAGLQSQLETLQLTIGQKLIGVLTPLARQLAEIAGATNTFAEAMFAAQSPLDFLADHIKGVLLALGLAVPLLSPFTTGLSMLITYAQLIGGAFANSTDPLRTFVELVGAFSPALVPFAEGIARAVGYVQLIAGAFLNSTDPLRTFGELITILAPGILPVVAQVQNLATAFGTWLTGAIALATPSLQQIWTALQSIAATLLGQLPGALTSAQSTLAMFATFILTSVLPAIATFATWIAANLPAAIATFQSVMNGSVIPTIQTVITWLSANLPAAIAAGQAAFQSLASFVAAIIPPIAGIVQTTLTVIAALWQQHGAQVLTIAQSAWMAIQGIIQVALGVIQGVIGMALGVITGDWVSAMEQIRAANTTIWTGIQTLLAGILNAILAIFGSSLAQFVSTWQSNLNQLPAIATSVMNLALAAFKTAISQTPAIGKAIIDGMINGIKSAAGALASAAVSVVKNAISAAKNAIASHSPSKVTEVEIGQPFGQGIARGIINQGPAVADAAAAITRGAVDSAQGALDGLGAALTKKSGSADKKNAPTPEQPAQPAGPSLADIMLATWGEVNRNNALLVHAPFSNSAGLAHGGMGPVTNNGPTYNLGVTTNQNPAVVQQSFAMMQAMVAQ